MKLFIGTKKPARPVDVVNQGVKAGVSVGRFRITQEQAEEIRRAEAKGGQIAGLAVLLRIRRTC